MRVQAPLPLSANLLALGLVLVTGPAFLHVIGAVALLLFLPGYALSFLLLGPHRPAGTTALFALAVSISLTGLGSLALVPAHVTSKLGIIAVDGTVGIGAGIAVAWRFRNESLPERLAGQFWARTVVVAGGAIGVVILVVAFALDTTSVTKVEKQTSVALSAVTAGNALKIGVLAPGNASFSGTLELKRSSTVLQTWQVKEVPPGGRWSPSSSVQLPQGSGAMQLILSSHGSRLRVVRIVATGTSATA